MSALHELIYSSGGTEISWKILEMGQADWKGKIKGKMVGVERNTNMSEEIENYEKQGVWNDEIELCWLWIVLNLVHRKLMLLQCTSLL